MFFTYLRKELFKRKKQTFIISFGIALAITLVVVMSGVSNGIAASQAKALAAVYGVGTDLTVTKTTTTSSSTTGQQFKFGATSGTTNKSGTTRSLSQSSLRTAMGTTAFSSSYLTKVAATTNVSAATGILLLQNNSFSGQVANQQSGSSAPTGTRPSAGTSGSTAPTGGPDGAGVSSFSVSNFSVAGVSTTTTVGPLSSVTVKSGRLLTSADANKDVAVLDSNYATSASKKVGSTITIDSKKFTVVGIVSSATSSTTTTVANVYIPLKVAQTLSGDTGKITTIYVKANSASNITAIQTALKSELSGVTVNTQASLASTVTGAVSTAASIVNSFGIWIVLIALAAAFLLSILFTVFGVSRRTRELGTLKSIGWKNSRIVRQVTGEAVTQGLLGGVIGSALGVIAITVINLIHPTITSAASTAAPAGPGGGFGRAAATATTSSIDITAILTPEVIGYAFAIALAGGILAGIIGSWRAAHLRPVEALRSV